MFRTHDFTRGIAIDKDSLSRAAAQYLSQPHCRTGRFDWIFLDATVFTELEAFAHHVIATKSGSGVNWAHVYAGRSATKFYAFSALLWLLGIAMTVAAGPVLAYYLYRIGYPTASVVVAAAWMIFVLLRLVAYPGRWKRRRKSAQLLNRMLELYAMLGEKTISPRKLKEALDQAAADGVVLDAAVFGIADRLVARDPTAFIPSQMI